jgi:hypothetical protein
VSDLLLPPSLIPIRITAICSLVAGLIYFFKTTPMGYHQRLLQTPFAELPKTSRGLILALMHATGSGLICIGVTMAYLSWVTLPAHAPGALTTAYILVISAMIPMAKVTLSIGRHTPWWLILGLGLASIAGLWIFDLS